MLRPDLLRVTPDDPAYRREAEAEARFWQATHPFSLESVEQTHGPGPVDRYVNRRFTGAPGVAWQDVVARRGPFRRAAVLGTSALEIERALVESNSETCFTFVDISEGALARRQEAFGARFPGRIDTRVADLNFLGFERGEYDLIVSSSTIHHVTNLEHLAFQIGEGLTDDGFFFVQDYVGEPRFQFGAEKKRLFEAVFDRERRFTPGRGGGLRWFDDGDLSPFCGLRSDDILDVLRAHLDEVELHTAGTLTVPLVRCEPVDGVVAPPETPRRRLAERARRLLLDVFGRRLAAQEEVVGQRFLDELFLVGDVASDAGLVRPCLAFGVYRRRR
jgi:SAM-dependent methyltransferase